VKPAGPVHFIHLGGPILPQHRRAMETAQVHGAQIICWADEISVARDLPDLVETRPLYVAPDLRAHPIQPANVKDLFMWRILNNHGGMYLDMDTISLRPAWDLLTAGISVSREYHPDSSHPHPYNSAVVMAQCCHNPALLWLARQAKLLLDAGVHEWGAIGPHLLTQAVAEFPDEFSIAPYRALNGWSYHDIQDYYDDPRDPGEDVRVIHLYSSSYRTQFENDRWRS